MGLDKIKDVDAVAYRPATLDDAIDIRNILLFYVDNTCASWRYTTPNDEYYHTWMANHQSPQRPVFVAEWHGQIVGFSSLSDFRTGEGYWPVTENSVYVLPEYQGLGIGQELMKLIIEQGRKAGLKAIVAGIDGENLQSIRFHERFGFYTCGTLKDIGWKQDSWRTLVFMQLDLF
jgi:L-amino acid N-acyltransferase